MSSINIQGTTLFGLPNDIIFRHNALVAGLSTGPQTHYGLGEVDSNGAVATGMVATLWAFATMFFTSRQKTFNIARPAYDEFNIAHQGDLAYGPFLWDAYGLNSTQALGLDTTPKPLTWIINDRTLGQSTFIPELIYLPRAVEVEVEELPFCSRYSRMAKAAEDDARYLKFLKKIGVPPVVATPPVVPRHVGSIAQSITAPAIANENVLQTTLLDFYALNIVGDAHERNDRRPSHVTALLNTISQTLATFISTIVRFYLLSDQLDRICIIFFFLSVLWMFLDLMFSLIHNNASDGDDKADQEDSRLASTVNSNATPSGSSGAKPPRRRRHLKRS